MKMTKSEAGKLGREKSRATQEAALAARKKAYYAKPNTCPECNAVISYEDKTKKKKKFCNSSCSAKYNNRKPIIFTICCICKVAYIKQRASTGDYCSAICLGQYKREKCQLEYLLGERILAPSKLKILVIDINGHLCSICGLTHWCGKPVPLVMDHIDGNSNNNKFYNLRLVCGNCDMQLPTYKSKNKGNGRSFRRERYKNKQSY